MLRPARQRAHRVRGAAVLATSALILSLGAAVPPSSDDVNQARENEDALAGSVAQLEVELATLGSAAQAAMDAAATAGEEYVTATVELGAAKKEADAAGARLTTALDRMEASRKVLVGVALEQYRSGGAIKNLEAVLSADGITEVIERTSSLGVVGSVADTAVQQYRADSLVAQNLQEQADQSLARAKSAASKADAAYRTSQDKQEAADAALAEGETRRSALIASLAAARNTTTALERERQDALDAARQQREEDAARRDREQTPPPTSTPTQTPTKEPTKKPTKTPTQEPAQEPTQEPTQTPTQEPTQTPTQRPTQAPTQRPTQAPTKAPKPPADPVLGTGRSVGTAAQGAAAVRWAKKRVGLPYGWGANGPDAYDCSSLTMSAWAAQGVGITRTSRSQYQYVKKISYSQMRPGDLIFWASNTSDPSTINHVAMYAGGGMMVEAARPGVPLRVTAVRYANTMPYAGRP